ncbi:hypothetical protein BS50DRAFT_191504 [Corynespora cassiicola Philippines]|uniref:Secreted protein n=1 Tax=Corynespora cassiicola Philippines TaxID=1448308 RepID=A0A2T2P8C1_CORCC|nr:hypothetical protein BS50DRAFT_191504 [Corynespora cassiicola Philippines]
MAGGTARWCWCWCWLALALALRRCTAAAATAAAGPLDRWLHAPTHPPILGRWARRPAAAPAMMPEGEDGTEAGVRPSSKEKESARVSASPMQARRWRLAASGKAQRRSSRNNTPAARCISSHSQTSHLSPTQPPQTAVLASPQQASSHALRPAPFGARLGPFSL